MCQPKVIGRKLPETSKDLFRSCDDCLEPVNCSFGETRNLVTSVYHDGTREDRYICNSCLNAMFEINEPDEMYF